MNKKICRPRKKYAITAFIRKPTAGLHSLIRRGVPQLALPAWLDPQNCSKYRPLIVSGHTWDLGESHALTASSSTPPPAVIEQLLPKKSCWQKNSEAHLHHIRITKHAETCALVQLIGISFFMMHCNAKPGANLLKLKSAKCAAAVHQNQSASRLYLSKLNWTSWH